MPDLALEELERGRRLVAEKRAPRACAGSTSAELFPLRLGLRRSAVRWAACTAVQLRESGGVPAVWAPRCYVEGLPGVDAIEHILHAAERRPGRIRRNKRRSPCRAGSVLSNFCTLIHCGAGYLEAVVKREIL